MLGSQAASTMRASGAGIGLAGTPCGGRLRLLATWPGSSGIWFLGLLLRKLQDEPSGLWVYESTLKIPNDVNLPRWTSTYYGLNPRVFKIV